MEKTIVDNVIGSIKQVFSNKLSLCSKYFNVRNCCCSPNIEFQRVFLLPGEKEILQRENDIKWKFNIVNGMDELHCYKRGIDCNVKAVECYMFPFLPIAYNHEVAEILAAFPMCPLYNDIESDEVKNHLRSVFKAGRIIENSFPNWLKQRKGSSGYTATYTLTYGDIDYLELHNPMKINFGELSIPNKLIKYFDILNYFVNSIVCINFANPIVFKEVIEITYIKIIEEKEFPIADCYLLDNTDHLSGSDLLYLINKIFKHTKYIVLFNEDRVNILPYKVLIKDGFYIISKESVFEYNSFVDWVKIKEE